MKSVVLLFNNCCIYEIVILNYFLKFTGKDVVFVSPDGKGITAMEGYSINVEKKLEDIPADDAELVVIPGGEIKEIDNKAVWKYLNAASEKNAVIAGICAGVDVLDHAGILNGVRSTHSTEEDVVCDGNVITARANGYVDFAIEVGKKMELFKDEADLQETIDFWKKHKRMQ
ncbi:MAG: DJ-1/PfpI family protein [Butyrivibrio sp.]|nr:DJ-1/PfpI family protein [Butyrivibrio sp.]